MKIDKRFPPQKGVDKWIQTLLLHLPYAIQFVVLDGSFIFLYSLKFTSMMEIDVEKLAFIKSCFKMIIIPLKLTTLSIGVERLQTLLN